jgi:hypothetical protein
MTTVGRTWQLYAYRYESGTFHHVGAKGWVRLHQLPHPLVPVLVEEILGDPYVPEVTHYGWQYVEGSQYRHGDAPTMIQIRAGMDPKDPKRSMMLLAMCFAYGLDAELERGEGNVVALRITERKEDP